MAILRENCTQKLNRYTASFALEHRGSDLLCQRMFQESVKVG